MLSNGFVNSLLKISVSRFYFLFFVSHSTRLLAATTLRNVLGTKNLSQILGRESICLSIVDVMSPDLNSSAERESIAHTMQSVLDEATDPWGVKVERVEM